MNFIKDQSSPLFWPYHRLRSSWPVWFYFLNRKPRYLWRRHSRGRLLSSAQEEIVSELRRNGIAVTHINKLFPEERYRKLEEYGRELWTSPEAEERISRQEQNPAGAKDDLIVHLFGGYSGIVPELDLEDPFSAFILDDGILEIAGAYFGACPVFRMFSLHSTVLVPPSSPAVFSQRWHRDPDDKKIVKVFLYLSDVPDEGAGPFSYIRGSQLGGKRRGLFPQIPPVGRYPKPGEVEKIVPPGDIEICRGRAGTLIFCDTSGLHRGGYSTKKRRLMFAGTFVTAASIQPKNYILKNKRDSLSLLASFALLG